MKTKIFTIEHKNETYHFLFNRTLGEIRELVDAQQMLGLEILTYPTLHLKRASIAFKAMGIFRKSTWQKQAVIKKLRSEISDYLQQNCNLLTEKYEEHVGQLCPYCESDDIEYASEREVSAHQKDKYMQQQLMSCRSCKKRWREHLELAFIEPDAETCASECRECDHKGEDAREEELLNEFLDEEHRYGNQ